MNFFDKPDAGRVFWVTGLPGAGKSTIGRLLCDRLRSAGHATVLLDGDELRKVFFLDENESEQGYDLESRRQLALKYSCLCKVLAGQGLDVVCATVSMFHEVQARNRSEIEKYFEIFLDCPIDVLKARDQKGLYSRARQGLINNVPGVDLEPEFPKKPSIRLISDNSRAPEEICRQLFEALKI